ncbi:MAG: DMT family transporter [Alphaproteobacteria bacterium]|nr:DMT family transporter [Alphaproteobacteria bacterium]
MSEPAKPIPQSPAPEAAWYALLPGIFVFFWATGFIAAKLGIPYAGPMTFLALRFIFVLAILVVLALVMRAPWPPREDWFNIAVAGICVHAGYLGFVFASVYNGVEAGVSAMMAGLQPVLTAALAGPLLGEIITRRQWAGFALGFLGVALVVHAKLAQGLGTPIGMSFAFLACVSMTAGTLWQKRHGSRMDIRTGSIIQFSASLILVLPLAIWLEGFRHTWAPDFIIAMVWLVVVLSIGTIFVLLIVIRRGAISKISTLFFLVPPTTALMAWALFNETLGPLSFIGMVMIAIAVLMVTWSATPAGK